VSNETPKEQPGWAGRAFLLLPLVLLGAMVGIALLLEPLRYGTSLWATKVPILLLLAATVRRRRPER